MLGVAEWAFGSACVYVCTMVWNLQADTISLFMYSAKYAFSQMPGGRSDSAGGRRQQVAELGRAGISQGIAGLFLEAHPDPDNAKCDGPCALRLDRLEPFLTQMQTLDNTVKAFPAFDNH